MRPQKLGSKTSSCPSDSTLVLTPIKIRFTTQEENNKVPSIKIPMRSDSVPVLGYLSFLASSSPIANDLIPLHDHLHHELS